MRPRPFSVLTTAALVGALALTACSTDSAGSKQSSSGADGDEKVTLQVFDSYASEDPHGQYIYQYADAFMAENPNVTIEITAVPSADIFTKLAAMATDPSSLPTLYFTSADQAPSLYDLGFTEDLANYLDEDELASFGPGVVDGAKLGDVIALYPVAIQPIAMLYHIDRFEEAGVEVPRTWDEFVEVGKKLTDGDTSAFAMVGSNNSSGQSRFLFYLWSNCLNVVSQDDSGKWVTDVDSPEFLEAFKTWTDMPMVDHIVPDGVTNIDYPTAANYFAMGYADMMQTGPNALGVAYAANPELEGNVGSFPLPGKCPGTFLGTEGYAMSSYASDAQKEAAIKYLDFINDNDPELGFWKSSGKLPASESAQKDPFFSEDKAYAGYLETIEQGTVPILDFPGLAPVKSALGDAYSAVFAGEATNEQAVAKLKKDLDQILAEEN